MAMDGKRCKAQPASCSIDSIKIYLIDQNTVTKGS